MSVASRLCDPVEVGFPWDTCLKYLMMMMMMMMMLTIIISSSTFLTLPILAIV